MPTAFWNLRKASALYYDRSVYIRIYIELYSVYRYIKHIHALMHCWFINKSYLIARLVLAVRARALPPPQDHAAAIIARATYTTIKPQQRKSFLMIFCAKYTHIHTHIDGFSAHKNTESICHKMASGRTARALGWSTFIYEENLCVMRDGNSIFMCMRNNIFMITVYVCVCIYK